MRAEREQDAVEAGPAGRRLAGALASRQVEPRAREEHAPLRPPASERGGRLRRAAVPVGKSSVKSTARALDAVLGVGSAARSSSPSPYSLNGGVTAGGGVTRLSLPVSMKMWGAGARVPHS